MKFEGKPTKVGIISLEPMRQTGLTCAFEGHPTIEPVVAELEVVLDDSSIHFVILDITDGQNWMELQLLVKRARPDMQLLMLGPPGNEELILRSITAGARGYLDAGSGPLAVRLATESMIQGSIWAPRRLLSLLIDRLLSHPGAGVTATTPVLSPRERQVLDLIMGARSNREIAEELGIEERTVKAYVASLLRKTGADNRVTLSVQATQESMRESRAAIPARVLTARGVQSTIRLEGELGPD